MPNFDKKGPRGEGQTGKGLGECRGNMPTENRDDNSCMGGLRGRIRGCFAQSQDRRPCSGSQGQGRNRQRGQGQK